MKVATASEFGCGGEVDGGEAVESSTTKRCGSLRPGHGEAEKGEAVSRRSGDCLANLRDSRVGILPPYKAIFENMDVVGVISKLSLEQGAWRGETGVSWFGWYFLGNRDCGGCLGPDFLGREHVKFLSGAGKLY
jgi:hypothetical protein